MGVMLDTVKKSLCVMPQVASCTRYVDTFDVEQQQLTKCLRVL